MAKTGNFSPLGEGTHQAACSDPQKKKKNHRKNRVRVHDKERLSIGLHEILCWSRAEGLCFWKPLR